MRESSLWARPWAVPAVAFLLFAATVASRVPFASQMLYAWDSANFALALQQYNVVFHQPHPPGYPLYVALASLLNLWLHDANASLVAISVVASGGAVGILFLLATRMYNPWIGLVSAVLLGVSVGFWGYGEVAYPYPCLAFFGVLVAWLCYLMWQGHRWVAVLSGLLLALAAGVRQDTLLFLGPLWLVSVGHFGILRLGLSTLVLCLAVLAWLLPAVWLSGGLAAFQQASSVQSNYVFYNYSVFYAGLEGLRRNTETLLLFLKQMFGLSLVVAVYFSGRFLTFRALVADHRLGFLLLWFLPPVLVYLLVHIGDPGYILSLLPPLCIVTAVGINDIAHDLRSALLLMAGRYRRLSGLTAVAGNGVAAVAALIVVALVAWNVTAFLLSPGPARWVEIRTIDNILARQTEYARQYQPQSVVVLAKARFRQLKYYMPGYDVRLLYDEYEPGYLEARRSLRVPEGVGTVLVMDFGKQPSGFPSPLGGGIVLDSSPHHWVSLWRFEVRPGDTIEYGYDYFNVRSY